MDLSAFPYLQGNYAPVDEERDFDENELRIEGKVPYILAAGNAGLRDRRGWETDLLAGLELNDTATR